MSDNKTRILAEIDDDEVVEFCKDLCRIPSFTTEETPVARFLHGFFQDNGLVSELQEVEKGRFQTIARLPGSGGGHSLMFNGHIDIDPLGGNWTRDPWTPSVEDDRFYAAGVYNMKGGDAAMIMATLAAKRAGVKLGGDVMITAVVGELQAGVGTLHMLEQGVRADMAIVPEPYSTSNVITKHTGVMQLAIHVVGRGAHISRKTHGVNAILKMAKVARAVEAVAFRHETDPDLPDLPLHCLGTIRGGRGEDWEPRGANFVPDRCSVFVDVRFNQSMTPASVIEDLKGAIDSIAATEPNLDYEIEYPLGPDYGLATRTMMPCSTDADHPLVKTLVQNVKELSSIEPQVGAVTPFSYAGNDTSHLYEAGMPCLLYGPGGGFTEGCDDRWTSVEQILTCTRVYAACIADMCA